MKKLKAFTLLELLIGMIVSGLVVSFCLMGYFIVNKQFSTYAKRKQVLGSVSMLYNTLNNDIQNSTQVLKNSDMDFTCMYPTKAVSYRMDTSIVIRKESSVTDTFYLQTSDLILSILENTNGEKNRLINKLSFDATLFNEKEPVSFVKEYAADVLMNEPYDY